LKRLLTSAVEIAVYERTGDRSGKKRKVTKYAAKNLLTFYGWDESGPEPKLVITVIQPPTKVVPMLKRLAQESGIEVSHILKRKD